MAVAVANGLRIQEQGGRRTFVSTRRATGSSSILRGDWIDDLLERRDRLHVASST